MKEYKEEFVLINGIEHYFLHYPKDNDLPVVLYIHGGPGNAESLFAYQLDEAWGNLCTQVHYDQRGAGKTLRRNKKAANPMSIDQLVMDLHGVVEHIKQYYHKEKIVILGHSWGTLIGSLYAQKHPDNISAYIGTGQVINMRENERVGYERAMELAKKAGNQKHIRQLEQIGDYPPEDVDTLLKLLPKVRKVQESYENGESGAGLIKYMFRSPTFKLTDMIAMISGMKINKGLIPQMLDFDLYCCPLSYKLPVHYISGADDTTTPIALSKVYFDKLNAPRKTLAVIDKAAHNPMFEQPEAFADELQRILHAL